MLKQFTLCFKDQWKKASMKGRSDNQEVGTSDLFKFPNIIANICLDIAAKIEKHKLLI